MKRILPVVFLGLVAGGMYSLEARGAEKSPADNLPPYISRLTDFGERADFSHDGKKILFLAKTYGDAYEIDIATKTIRAVTHHFYHAGFTRALYLSNGDILLSGCPTFDRKDPHYSRNHCELYVLDKSLTKPPTPLGEMCSEGPCVSRSKMRFCWTLLHEQVPDKLEAGRSQIWMGDLDDSDPAAAPKLVNKKLVLDSQSLPFKCTLECQNFRPPAEDEITFSAYGYNGTDVCGVNLATGKVTNYSNAPGQYDEPEGIYPDGRHTLVECDKHRAGQKERGSGWIDLYKLKLDGSGDTQRLTHFNDFPGYKASNPVVSDDGKFIAFQMAKTKEPAGVGHGIFLLDLTRSAPDGASPAAPSK
jgi:hypothetical protein